MAQPVPPVQTRNFKAQASTPGVHNVAAPRPEVVAPSQKPPGDHWSRSPSPSRSHSRESYDKKPHKHSPSRSPSRSRPHNRESRDRKSRKLDHWSRSQSRSHSHSRRTGVVRALFQLESVQCLREALKLVGSNLLVARARPEDFLPKLLK